ncbi:nucleotidyltransferase domain-containing protein [Corallococcus carmarthensis]|uniref:Cyclic GMP-AMP synthase n=1 Tax=Corallococcus carmarthensis TaxID=2316728 RepID=A0A3A8KKE5_9BACT|nr:nucleotidyltransferase [Corallococcus carmarthensis]RKH04691.1 nucleotidyltransferase [Corallococcus carmarthensis]
MTMQSRFRRFHEAIQLKRYNENAGLVEKRDRVLRRLRENAPRSFEFFNQGSYAMGTGIKPLDGDYDIDVAIVFELNPHAFDPVEVKRWVYSAVASHTSRVEWRRSCITVYYQQAGEAVYHVDLAVMARTPNSRGFHLAIGKEHSADSQRKWQPDDRQGFIEAVENRFSGEEAAQFRRVIRYLKRWKDHHFSLEGRAAPTGLSLTVAAYKWFRPSQGSTWMGTEESDLAATLNLVKDIRRNFSQVWDSDTNRSIPRLSLQFPNAPFDDVLKRMTHQQMEEFHQRIVKLDAWLEHANRTGSVTSLTSAFGDDFPDD